MNNNFEPENIYEDIYEDVTESDWEHGINRVTDQIILGGYDESPQSFDDVDCSDLIQELVEMYDYSWGELDGLGFNELLDELEYNRSLDDEEDYEDEEDDEDEDDEDENDDEEEYDEEDD